MVVFRLINFKFWIMYSHINLFGNFYTTKIIASATYSFAFIIIRMLPIVLYGFKIITASQ